MASFSQEWASAKIIFALIDLIITAASLVKHLPKVVWVIIILIGPIIWILVGKDRIMPEGLVAVRPMRRHQCGGTDTTAHARRHTHDGISLCDDLSP